MLLPLIAHAAQHGLHEVPPYARWSAALHELREALEQNPDLAPARLPDYLEGVPSGEADEALVDLVAEHMRRAWCSGRPTRLEDYVAALGTRCSLLASLDALPADLVEDEFLVRHTLPGGDVPPLADYVRRFAHRPDVRTLLARRTLRAGRYVKLRRLGRGAMGIVWEACDRKLGRAVAIKEAHPELGRSPEAVARLVAEADAAARLDHPGIARVHEIVRDGDPAPWFVMDLVRGVSLAARIRELHHPEAARTRRETRRLTRTLLRCVVGIARATAHAHARGVVHGDLKPGNVVVGDADEAVILDWGAAAGEPAGAEAETGVIVGTPESMAPEQARGRVDERSDVFGLGSILYEVLTGGPVHTWPAGERPADWQRIVAQAQVVAPRRRRRGIPRTLDRICRKALAPDPAERYASARALADALCEHLDTLGPHRRLLAAVLRLTGRRVRRRALTEMETRSESG